MNIDELAREIWKLGKEYAQAKANRVYLQEFRKSKKAILFSQAPDGTIADRENYAYSHAEYMEVLNGLKEATEKEEACKWKLVALETRVDVWRTQEASKRAEMKAC